jgi:hypothetical protein
MREQPFGQVPAIATSEAAQRNRPPPVLSIQSPFESSKLKLTRQLAGPPAHTGIGVEQSAFDGLDLSESKVACEFAILQLCKRFLQILADYLRRPSRELMTHDTLNIRLRA